MDATAQVVPPAAAATTPDVAPAPSPIAGASDPTRFTITKCLRCDYPLAGLPSDGACPECGTPVTDSLHGAELAFANRRYLAAIDHGLWLACPGALLLYATMTVQGVLEIFRSLPVSRAYDVASISFCTVAILSVLGGLWLFTRPDLTAPANGPQQWARRWARIAMAVACGAVIMQIAVHISWREYIALAPAALQEELFIAWPVVMGGLSSITTLAEAAAVFFVMRYTRALAKRIPDARMVRACTLYQWLLPIVALGGLGWLVLPNGAEPEQFTGLLPVSALAVATSFPRRLRQHIKSILTRGTPARFSGMR